MTKLICLFLTLTLCCEGAERCKRASGDYRESDVYAETIVYEGHKWIHFNFFHWGVVNPFIIIHHPDCECQK